MVLINDVDDDDVANEVGQVKEDEGGGDDDDGLGILMVTIARARAFLEGT